MVLLAEGGGAEERCCHGFKMDEMGIPPTHRWGERKITMSRAKMLKKDPDELNSKQNWDF